MLCRVQNILGGMWCCKHVFVERPDVGDFARSYDKNARGASSYFTWLNRGKESLAIDVKNKDSIDLLKNVSDVFC